MKNKPRIVIIGRKNAGKSTLFNRLIEEERSITSPIPGTTRDANHAVCFWRGQEFELVDTGGLDPHIADQVEEEINKRTQKISQQADMILYVVDGKKGVLEADRKNLNQLKKNLAPGIITVVNKLDSKKQIDQFFNDFFRLGADQLIPLSAISGSGTGDLLDIIVSQLPQKKSAPLLDSAIKIVVIGRPNVGKSSLINAILNSDRLIVNQAPGTTRDAQYIPFQYHKKQFLIIDTAGVRKKNKVGRSQGDNPRIIEIASVKKSLKAIKQCHVALLVLDITEQVANQDQLLARTIINERKGIVLVANKWDLVKNKDDKTINFYRKYLLNQLPFLKWAPLIFVSAKEGTRAKKILEIVQKVRKNQTRIIPETELEEFIKMAVAHRPPTQAKGKGRVKILSLKQDQKKPFKFIIKIKPGQFLPEYYKSYLMNMLWMHFDLWGNPLEIIVKK